MRAVYSIAKSQHGALGQTRIILLTFESLDVLGFANLVLRWNQRVEHRSLLELGVVVQ